MPFACWRSPPLSRWPWLHPKQHQQAGGGHLQGPGAGPQPPGPGTLWHPGLVVSPLGVVAAKATKGDLPGRKAPNPSPLGTLCLRVHSHKRLAEVPSRGVEANPWRARRGLVGGIQWGSLFRSVARWTAWLSRLACGPCRVPCRMPRKADGPLPAPQNASALLPFRHDTLQQNSPAVRP